MAKRNRCELAMRVAESYNTREASPENANGFCAQGSACIWHSCQMNVTRSRARLDDWPGSVHDVERSDGYMPEFIRQLVDSVRSWGTPASLTKEIGPMAKMMVDQ